MKFVNKTLMIVLVGVFSIVLFGAVVFAQSASPFICKGDVYPFSPNIISAHSASIEVLPNGDLFATWFAGSREGARDVDLYGARRVSGQLFWSKPEIVVASTPDHSAGNSTLWYDNQTSKLWLFYVIEEGTNWEEAVVKRMYSTDLGLTWSEPIYVKKEWGWMSGTDLVELSNGDLLLPLYDEGGATGPKWSVMFYISEDRGDTWDVFPKDRQLTSPKGMIQGNVVELESGHLLMYARTRDTWVYKSESTDFGRTWSVSEKTDIPNNNARIALEKLDSGALVLVYNPVPYRGGPRNPLRVALSYDNGVTWPYMKDIENGPALAEYSYPWLTQGPDGYLHIAYTFRRTRIRYAKLNEAWIISGKDLRVPTQPYSKEGELALFKAGISYLPYTCFEGNDMK